MVVSRSIRQRRKSHVATGVKKEEDDVAATLDGNHMHEITSTTTSAALEESKDSGRLSLMTETTNTTTSDNNNGLELDKNDGVCDVKCQVRPEGLVVGIEGAGGGTDELDNRMPTECSFESTEQEDQEESCLLGIDCNEQSTVGLVLRIYADTKIHLDGDG